MILRAAAAAYGLIVSLRNHCFDNGVFACYRGPIPVISVGNVSLGGSGKTPLAILIVELLRAAGCHPVLLSRGYGGSIRGPELVKPDSLAVRVGDEPLLMARRTGAPVVVCRRRAVGAQWIAQHNLGDCIVLDDGLQHRWLVRDLDLVCINTVSRQAVEELLDGELFPLGSLREPLAAALRRASAVVLNRRALPGGRQVDDSRLLTVIPAGVPVFSTVVTRVAAYRLEDRAAVDPQEVVAFCGIANPEGFRTTLEHAGFTLCDMITFPDHYRLRPQDLAALKDRACGRLLICTEKDGVKIESTLRSGIAALEISVAIEPFEQFRTLLISAVKQGACSGPTR